MTEGLKTKRERCLLQKSPAIHAEQVVVITENAMNDLTLLKDTKDTCYDI